MKDGVLKNSKVTPTFAIFPNVMNDQFVRVNGRLDSIGYFAPIDKFVRELMRMKKSVLGGESLYLATI